MPRDPGFAHHDRSASLSLRPTSFVQRARHLDRLLRDTLWMARVNRLWWLPLLVVVMFLAITAATTTQSVLPYAVYAFF